MKSKGPRAICLDILTRNEEAGHHPDSLLDASFKKYRHLTSLDRAFLTELTYGVLRWRGRLDWVILHFSKIPFEKIEPKILQVLRIGLYQILFLSRTPASAAVNESAEMAKGIRGKGGAAFVNAVLRSVLRENAQVPYPDIDQEPALHLSVLHSHPLWLVQRWVGEVGVEEAMRICSRNNQIPALTLRTNMLKTRREDLMRRLKEKGLRPTACAFSEEGILLSEPPPVSELPFLREGLFIIQDEASQLIISVSDPKPGEKILDACAAPGGKTTQIAQRMQNKGMIYALDLTREKLARIEGLCQTLGVSIVRTLKADARRPLPVPEGMSFDRVLADAPCSGFGTLRRNPDLKWRRMEKDVRRLSELQTSILKNLSGYVKKGGVLVYSTCTVLHEENEDVVEGFLKEHTDFELEQLDGILPERLHPFIQNSCFKTFPTKDEMDGFFAARFKKR